MLLPVSSLKQLLARFLHHCGASRLCGCTPDVHHRSCLWCALWNSEWVAPSNSLWAHIATYRPMILMSFECVCPHQPNGASLFFMHCVVLELQLFFCIHAGYRKHGAIPFSEMHQSCTESSTSGNWFPGCIFQFSDMVDLTLVSVVYNQISA